MASFGTTARWALRYLLGSSPVLDVDAGFKALAEDIDGKLTPFSQGTRPVSTVQTPGKPGRIHHSPETGAVSLDHGTGWVSLIPARQEPLRAIRGRVTSTGVREFGANFTVVKNGTGSYLINFTYGFVGQAAILATPRGRFTAACTTDGATYATIKTYLDDAPADAPFDFLAVGGF